MLEAEIKTNPAYGLKLKTNHLKSPQLEEKLIKAMTDLVQIFFHNLGSTDVKVLIDNDSFKEIIAIHKEVHGNDSAPGILPILKELINDTSRYELIVPYIYLTKFPKDVKTFIQGHGDHRQSY